MKKVFSVLLGVMLLSLALLSVSAAPSGGMTFTADDHYETDVVFTEMVRTFETWVKVDKDAADTRLGIFTSNCSKADYPAQVGIEVRTDGNPYLYWDHPDYTAVRKQFTDVDVRTGEWMHLVITVSETEAKCYVNGVLVQTHTGAFPDMDTAKAAPYVIGGDHRKGNAYYCQYEMATMRMYSEVLTEAQVAAFYAAPDNTAESLLCAYDFTVTGEERLMDHSPKKNNIIYTNVFDGRENLRYYAMDEGLVFRNNGIYRAELSALPSTIEAEVYFPATFDHADRGGVVLGNYWDEKDCINLEIYTNGRVRYGWREADFTDHTKTFADTDVYSGEWVHIAVTHDWETGEIKCYLDGELVAERTDPVATPPDNLTFVIGGDNRGGDPQFFKGNLRSLAVYGDVRTAEEIRADMIAPAGEDLLLAYDFSQVKKTEIPAVLTDLSNSGADAPYEAFLVDGEFYDGDYVYSMAVIGDTQKMVYYNPAAVPKLYDWIVENVAAKKIGLVLGLGDITDKSTTAEWNAAKAGIAKLDGVVPYSVIRGNHDSTATYNSAFIGSTYDTAVQANGAKFSEDSLETTYQIFTVGDTKYLVLCLDYGPTDEELAWANAVVSAHPECKVIVTTHAYLHFNGDRLELGEWLAPPTNGGVEIWDKLIRKHENIVLVLSGHVGEDDIVVAKSIGDHGNTVTQMLIDAQDAELYQGALGVVTMLYFSADGRSVTVESYSTVQEKFFYACNRFTVQWGESIGDVDLDYSVDIKDVLLAIRAVLNETPLDRADLNGDGNLTLADVLRIMKRAV